MIDENAWLAERFEAHRAHLGAVAYRMLGSLSEAEDVVQEAWLRFARADTSSVENLGGWLTTVVARLSLDALRSRKTAREEPLGARDRAQPGQDDPEREMILADSVGFALLVVLDRLAPAERIAFVLHDLFDMPFEEIAAIVDRSPTAARQLASRARRRVRGGEVALDPDLDRQREVVDAFPAAARGGDLDGLLAILDPDVVIRTHRPGEASEVCGARNAAERAAKAGARAARAVLIDGSAGLVVAPAGRLLMVLRMTIVDGRITAIDAIADAEQLGALELALLPD